MTDDMKEIQSVLLGQITFAEDGRITPVQKGQFHLSTGVGDGAAAVRFLGMAKRSCCYDTKLKPNAVNEAARKSMQEIGRGVLMHRRPDTVACLIRYVLTKPTVLTFRYVDGIPTLTAWTGRGLFSGLSLRRAMSAFGKNLPETITRSDSEPPKPPECIGEEKKKKDKRKKKTQAAQRAEEQEPVPQAQEAQAGEREPGEGEA